jgi:O-antigen/teichoic acid export membrane protein
MSPTLHQKAFSGSIHQYIAAVVIAVFSALTSIYIIRGFTVDDFGIYNFFISIIATAQVVTSLGLGPTVQRYLSEFIENKNNYLQKRIVSVSMLIRFGAAFVFVLILLSAEDWIISIFNLPASSEKLFPFLTLIILLSLESQLLGDSTLLALFENRYRNFSRIIYTCLKFILFYFSLSMGYGIFGVLASWLFVEIVLFLLFLFKTYKVIFTLPVKQEDIRPMPIRRIVNFGGYLVIAQAGYFFRDKAADIFILSYFLGTYEVGLYSFAFGIPLMLLYFSPGSTLRGVLTPLLVRSYIKTKDKQQLSYFFKLINKTIAFSTLPFFMVLMILADKVIANVFNSEYLKVTNLFILSLGFMMIQQFVYAYTLIIYTLENTRIIFIGSFFAFYNLVMDFILIPILGILGAILATGSAGILLLLYYNFAMKLDGTIQLKYPWRSFAIFFLNSAVAAIVAFLLRDFINGIPSLICVLAIAGIVYLGLCYLNKGFDEKDRKIFNEAIKKDVFVF